MVVMIVPLHQVVYNVVCSLMALSGEMEVDHGGVQAAVAQILLDAADVDTRFQEMGGIAVSEGMNGDALLNMELF